MPITPRPKAAFPSADTATPFDATLTVPATAETLVAVPSNKFGRIVSLVNEGPGDVALAFDAVATVTDLLLLEETEVSRTLRPCFSKSQCLLTLTLRDFELRKNVMTRLMSFCLREISKSGPRLDSGSGDSSRGLNRDTKRLEKGLHLSCLAPHILPCLRFSRLTAPAPSWETRHNFGSRNL